MPVSLPEDHSASMTPMAIGALSTNYIAIGKNADKATPRPVSRATQRAGKLNGELKT
jgi:hypothetical protein